MIIKPRVNGAVLFADDDPDDRQLFTFSVQDAQWQNPVIEFEDGEPLIEYLKRLDGELPALVVLDIKMTKIGGLDVLRWMRTRRELDTLPTVILSSSNLERDIREAMSLGVVEYRMKPTKYADLVRLAKDFRQRWLERPAPASPPAFEPDRQEGRRRRPPNPGGGGRSPSRR
jgi:two-component system response regulator